MVTPVAGGPAPWPEAITADTRGILRNHPLTLPLTRAIDTMGRAGRSVALIVSRSAGAIGCNDCGTVLRCPECGVALQLRRDRRGMACRVCARADALPERCPGCGGHRLQPFGWDAERVEAEVAGYTARVQAELESQKELADSEANAERLSAPDARRIPVSRTPESP
jgi:primosomal protein N'